MPLSPRPALHNHLAKPGGGFWLQDGVVFQNFFDALLTTGAAALLISSAWELLQERPDSNAEAALLFVNGVLAIVGFFGSLRGRSPIFMTAFYFDFIFFSVGPLQQISISEDPIYADHGPIITSIWLFLMSSLIGLFFKYFHNLNKADDFKRPDSFLTRSIFGYEFAPELLFAVCLFTNISLIYLYRGYLATSREAFSEFLNSLFDKSFIILLLSFLNPFTFVSATIGLIAALKSRSALWVSLFSLCLILAIIVNNPMITARFRLSTLLCFLLLSLSGNWRNTRLLICFLIIGTYISPILNQFRYDTPDYTMNTFQGGGFFSTMDYHILNLMGYTILYCEQFGYSLGSNIFSALLFFIPRAIWDEKSQHVTYYMIDFVNNFRYYGTDNLSSPPVLEGYFAFGLTGSALLVTAIFMALRWIERMAQVADVASPATLFACAAPMLIMILMRGPFIVGYSEFICMFSAILLAVALLGMHARKTSRRYV